MKNYEPLKGNFINYPSRQQQDTPCPSPHTATAGANVPQKTSEQFTILLNISGQALSPGGRGLLLSLP